MNTSFNVFALSRRGNPLARLGWQANSLLVTATLILSAFPAGFALADTTDVLTPNGQGSYTGWTGDEDDIDETGTASCSTGGGGGSDGSGNIAESTGTGDRESVLISLATIPTGATITSVEIQLTHRNGNDGGADDGTYQTFTRLNGVDLDSGVNLAPTNTTCTGVSQTIDVPDTVKSGGTTLEVGVVKTGADTSEVWIGTIRAVVTFDMDGLGTMDVSPATVGANSTGNSFTFTFANGTGADFDPSSFVRLTVPAGWTDPTGNLTVTDVGGSGCSPDTTPTISGTGPWTIDITHTCTDGNSFTVEYDNVTAPATLGAHTFTTLSQDGASGLAAIASSPVVTVETAHEITVTNGGNGTVTPGTVLVIDGDNQSFDITPDAGYIVADVLVDTVSQGRVNEYTFSSVVAPHTLGVTFENGWYDAADATDPGGNDVTNEDGMLSSDNSRANFDSSNDEAELEDFDFVSPLGGVIEGFEVAIEAQGDATVRTLEVSLSWDGGSTFTTVQDTGVFTTQEKTVILGGPTDDWGRTWSLSEISNANFRVMVNATSNSGGSGDDIDVDQVQVKVHYATDNTPPSGGSIDYTDGYYTTASVPVTYTLGTDGESGLNTASGKIQRASAALLSGGSCDTFGSFSDLVTESDGSYDDNSVTTGNCYMYQYVIEDNAGNEATYTSSNVAQVDTVAPTVAIDTQIVVANPTNINPIPMEITFSEDVTGFDDTDIAIVGGTVSNFAAVNDAEYTFDLVPDTDPITMTVNIAGSVATDLAGNANTAATQFARTYNSTALSVTITSGPADGDVINVNNTAFSFTTDGDEAGCAIDSNPVIGADLCTSFVAPAGSHTLAGPLGEGLHTFAVKVAKAGFVDVLLETDFTVDTTQPTVALSSPWIIGGFASTSPLTIDVLFSDAVTDFLDGDVTAVGGVLGTLSGSGASYALDITIGADGPVTVDVAAGVANEANGSGWMNLAAPQLAFVFDGTPPVIDILSGPTDGSSINVFSDSFDFTVTDANVVDVSCSFDNGATSTPCTSPQGFGPFADGVHTFLIYAIDEAGNFAEKLTSFTIDTVLPVVSEVTAIGTTTDTTPDYIFNSSEEGTFVLGGACSTGSSSGASGDNTITLDTLSVGTYTDCTVTLTDDAGNVSNILDISDFTIEAPSSGGGGGGGGGGSLSNPPQAQSTPIPGFTGPTGGNTGGQVLGASTEFSGDSQVGDGEETGGTGDSQNTGGQVLGASTETGGGSGSGAQDEVVEDETGTTTDESSAMSDAQKAAAGLALKGVPAWLIAILIVLITLGLWFGWRWYNRS